MIVTVTPNPSIDRTVTLAEPLTRGAVHRVTSVIAEPGGKGINVARALTLAGVDAVALLPAPATDPIITALRIGAVPFRCVPTSEPVRTNVTITESDGTTTKLNAPGAALDHVSVEALTRSVMDIAETASWIVLSGSLPPGVPDDWYAMLVRFLADYPCRIAVDTSGAPLAALVNSFDNAAPDLLKPNAEELAGMLGLSAEILEAAAAEGDSATVVSAARQLIERGVPTVLATFGSAGAFLIDREGSWLAAPPAVTPRSTVGAGDASLAGYIRADAAGGDQPQKLRMAVAYGSAATALAGSAMPVPSDIDLDGVRVTPVVPSNHTKVLP